MTNALTIGPKNTIVWLPIKFNGFAISRKKIAGVTSFNSIIFLTIDGQNDSSKIQLIMFPSTQIINLKSLKEYLKYFKNKKISSERLVNTIYDDIKQVYKPVKLKIIIQNIV